MRYATYADFLPATWTIPTGTPRTDYGVTNLGDLDPSNPVWITGTTIRVTADLGSAQPVAAVAIIAHNFDEDLTVLVQANSSNSFGSPPLSMAITIEAPFAEFGCNALLDLSAVLDSASRTYRFWSITNSGDSNSVSVAIGEIVFATEWRTMDPSLRHDYRMPQTRLAAQQSSKRGVQTIYDFGARERSLIGSTRVGPTALDTVLDWCDIQRQQVRPMLVQIDENATSRRHREVRLCRFDGATIMPVSLIHNIVYDVDLAFEELGSGQVLGA